MKNLYRTESFDVLLLTSLNLSKYYVQLCYFRSNTGERAKQKEAKMNTKRDKQKGEKCNKKAHADFIHSWCRARTNSSKSTSEPSPSEPESP